MTDSESHEETPPEGAEPWSEEATAETLAGVALARASAEWQRRGYRLRYRDPYLAQLIRRGLPDPLSLALGVAALAAVGVFWLLRRRWVVVTLTAAPDGQVIAHRQRSAHPPET